MSIFCVDCFCIMKVWDDDGEFGVGMRGDGQVR